MYTIGDDQISHHPYKCNDPWKVATHLLSKVTPGVVLHILVAPEWHYFYMGPLGKFITIGISEWVLTINGSLLFNA